ncbi:competence protein CoiA family protein [Streptomyces sp. NPDC024089]|uniref:competence protein CoiA family protein n=1 Tax=Streptomyces sp. NPDC024089 TaxID=3154328 RepID=UPI0033ED83CB
MSVVDTRLVQTAVIGTRDSDQPVILPEQPYNLDQFRSHFQDKRFWCGTLLGGCGEELMTKRYETKVCHFAHFPDRTSNAAACHRIANGADSADHLFIKRDVTLWLKSCGFRPQAELRNLGHGPGDAVDFWLPKTRQRLRFQLGHQDYRTWYRAEQEFGTASEQMNWIFGVDGPISANMMQRQGYALRVKCETDGSDRRVFIGTEHPGRPVAWSALDECRLTPDGLVTLVLEELLSDGSVTQYGKGAWLRPATFPLRADQIVFAIDAKAPTPTRSPLAADGRYIITADVKPAGSRIIRAHVSLPDDIPMPTEQYVYRLVGVARLLLTDPDPREGVQWAVRADGVTQLSGIEAERTGLWRPAVALPEPVRKLPGVPAPAQRPIVMPTTTGSGRLSSAGSPSAAPARVDAATAARVRAALQDFARRRTPTTWSTLATVARVNLARLSPPERRDLLVAVDRLDAPDKPLLSALVRDASGHPLPDMPYIIRNLGLPVPADNATLRLWCNRETERAYQDQSTSHTRMLPARLALRADGKPSERPVPAQPEKRAAPKRIDKPIQRGPLEQGVDRLRQALQAAEELLPRTRGQHHKRLSDTIKGARSRLSAFDAAQAKGTPYLDWLGSRADTPNHHAQLLVKAIKAVEPHASHHPVPTAEPPKTSTSTPPPVNVGTARCESRADTSGSESAEDLAAEQFDVLVNQFKEAQRALDADRAESIYRMANPIYRLQLSPALQHQKHGIVGEMRTWVGEQQPNRSSALLKRCQRLIHRMGEEKDAMSADVLSALIAEAEALSKRVTLSDTEQKALTRARQHLQALRDAEKTTPSGDLPHSEPGAEGRLSREQVFQMASAVRAVLEQTARGQALTTWGELRRRLGEGVLPHLHPDDQGEVLVAVERDTPADEPLLSSLIVVGGGEIHPLYRHVAFSLGRDVPLSDVALRSEWTVDVLRLRALWKHR